MSTPDLPAWKSELISLIINAGALTFGTYKLKSNRISPYFVNCGLFSRGRLIPAISSAYAQALNTYCLLYTSPSPRD